MNLLFSLLLPLSLMASSLIFDFTPQAELNGWTVVDDGVMGGRSTGKFGLSPEGHGLFQGHISLANNGGFSSLRYSFPRQKVGPHTAVVIRLKGDGKRYQFRLKHRASDAHSYVHYFPTSGEWEEVVLPLEDFYPVYRGRKLDQANFPGKYLAQVGFLIGNQQEQDFKLLVDRIALQ
ncbi:MAG: CIA30 family protein [Schleiferiaceae bacterium]|nr:CIA30 family protein [Schleiferiaceae bacterium]